MTNNMALAEMISKARKEQGLQQAELAELVGKGRKTGEPMGTPRRQCSKMVNGG